MNKKLIDIHTHIVPLVDDGSKSFDESIIILEQMIEEGIEAVILTPHFQSVATKGSLEEKYANFKKLESMIEERNLSIKIYYGHEVRYQPYMKPEYKELTLNNGKYILMEFSYGNDPEINEVISNLRLLGLKVIIAHVERYVYLNYRSIVELKESGALIQVNARAVYEPHNRRVKGLVRKLLKNKVIDFIASDTHNTTTRPSDLRKAYDFLVEKYDDDYLEDIFYNNPQLIIDN